MTTPTGPAGASDGPARAAAADREEEAVHAPQVSGVAYPDLGAGAPAGPSSDLDLLADVDLRVSVELGSVRMKLRDLLRLVEGSVVELNRAAGAPVDVLVNATLVARGEVVVVDDELGVRVTELLRRA